jgi:murein DD-endopeptidase MepM/ murein hydrolase activator NlpD
MLHFKYPDFHSVINLPQEYEIYDFTKGYSAERMLTSNYGVGKYNEKRVGMYEQDLFSDGRDIHVGVDIAAPVGTPVHAFASGKVFLFDYNSARGDYGYTLITEHFIEEQKFYALFGHLNQKSIETKSRGQAFDRGDVIAWLGDKHENGGWNPHLHFQLCLVTPSKADLPGVVNQKDLKQALEIYPDPRLILGALY